MVRRVLIALVLVLVASGAAVAWVWWHAQPKPIGDAYVGISDLALWDGTGPVRRRLESLPYGERLVILDRYSDWVEVRTPKGGVGWVSQTDLIDPEIWQKLAGLESRLQDIPAQAQGHTAVLSNVRIDPGRTSPRVGQLRKGTPVEIYGRALAPRGSDAASPKEDWLLIHTHTRQMGEVAGWVLADFIDADVPSQLDAYVTSSGMRPVAWFPLRKVNDPAQGPMPYYLLAGTSGPEGQACDFTMLRVYTWSLQRHQYETAFIQNGLCGLLPIHVTFESDKQQSVLFHFQNLGPAGASPLDYRMQDTIVRPLGPLRWKPEARRNNKNRIRRSRP